MVQYKLINSKTVKWKTNQNFRGANSKTNK